MSEKEKNSEEVEETVSEQKEPAEDVEATDSEEVQPLSETEELQQKLDEMEDKYLRAAAEIANMNSRFRTERQNLQKYRSQDLAKSLLPAIDNLERAVTADADEDQNESLKKGVQMVLESLHHALKEEGIEEIPAENAVFDPAVHQAVQTVPADEEHPAETIVSVLQKGYILHDRVLRASMVVVAQ